MSASNVLPTGLAEPATIVFLLHRAPYPVDKGEKIRAHHELRALIGQGHRVHLIAFVDTERDARAATALRSMCASVHLVRRRPLTSIVKAGSRVVTGGPLSLGYFGSRSMGRLVRRVLAEVTPDVVLAYSSVMWQYVPRDWWRKTVFDLVDADSEKWRALARNTGGPKRWIFALEAKRLSVYEGEIIQRSHATLVSTPGEGDVLRRNHGALAESRVRVLPNAVDAPPAGPVLTSDCRDAEALQRRPAIVFAGAMDYAPNVDAACYFAKEILPLICARAPAVLWIVGRDPSRQVSGLTADENVRVTGYVEDVKPYLAAASVAVVPVRIARGIQSKLLEAMAMQCAVVCTPEVNAAVGARHDEHLLVAESPTTFAEAVLRVLGDQNLRTGLGIRAQQFVAQNFGFQALDRGLNEIIVDARARLAVSGDRPTTREPEKDSRPLTAAAADYQGRSEL